MLKIQLFGGRGAPSYSIRTVRGYTTKIHEGRQGKHIPGHNNYTLGKSRLTISLSDIQQLINKLAGNKLNRWITETKEKVNFKRKIGEYIKPGIGSYKDTDWGIIHYSKEGTHVVPSEPDEY